MKSYESQDTQIMCNMHCLITTKYNQSLTITKLFKIINGKRCVLYCGHCYEGYVYQNNFLEELLCQIN